MSIIDQMVPDPSLEAAPACAKDLAMDLPAEWFLPSVHSIYFQLFSQLLDLSLSASQRESLAQPRLLPLLDYLPI